MAIWVAITGTTEFMMQTGAVRAEGLSLGTFAGTNKRWNEGNLILGSNIRK